MGVPNAPSNQSGSVSSISGGAAPSVQPNSVNSWWLTNLLTGALGGQNPQANQPASTVSSTGSAVPGGGPPQGGAGTPGPTPATQDIGQSKVAANSYLGGGNLGGGGVM